MGSSLSKRTDRFFTLANVDPGSIPSDLKKQFQTIVKDISDRQLNDFFGSVLPEMIGKIQLKTVDMLASYNKYLICRKSKTENPQDHYDNYMEYRNEIKDILIQNGLASQKNTNILKSLALSFQATVTSFGKWLKLPGEFIDTISKWFNDLVGPMMRAIGISVCMIGFLIGLSLTSTPIMIAGGLLIGIYAYFK